MRDEGLHTINCGEAAECAGQKENRGIPHRYVVCVCVVEMVTSCLSAKIM